MKNINNPPIQRKSKGSNPDVLAAQLAEKSPRQVIWDTDWWTDVDDVVAARILCWAERMGMIDIVCVGISAAMQYSVTSLDAFFLAEGRRGMTIGIDSAATDFGGSPPYQTNMANNNLHDYQSNGDAEDIVRMYRRALVNSTAQIDIIGVGYPQGLANLLKSTADDISSLTGLQLVTQKVRKLWMMAGKYPNGSENNFTRNARSISGGNYLCANWPTPITFLGWEVGNPVITGGTLASVSPASDDLLTKALADYGATGGRSSWDPMTTLLAVYGDANMAGFATVKGTNVVDASTGANTFTINPNGNHEYVVKIQTDNWYKNIINSIIEKKSWGARKVGGKQLPKLNVIVDTTPPVITSSVPSGTYAGTQTVSLSANEGALIFYTLDGSTPTTASTRYTAPVIISSTSTLKFFGIDAAGNASAVQSVNYTILGLVGQWLASDLTSNADGASIAQLPDHLGAYNMTASGTQMPVFRTSKVGLPALQFDATKMMLTPNIPLGQSATIYAKVLWDTLPTANQTILSQDDGGTRLWHMKGNSATSIQAARFVGGTGTTDSYSGSVSSATWHILTARFTPTTLEILLDGVSDGVTAITNPNTSTGNPLALGSARSTSLTEAFNGFFNQARIYSVTHDDATVASTIAQMNA